MEKEFKRFLISAWELEVWVGEKIIFRSKKSGVRGLLDFVNGYGRRYGNLVIFDKIVGRGVALLIVYLKVKNCENVSCRDEKRSRSLEVYGALGSELAAKVLKQHKVKFHFEKTVPNILNRDGSSICPIEKLSFDKSPEEFYHCFSR